MLGLCAAYMVPDPSNRQKTLDAHIEQKIRDNVKGRFLIGPKYRLLFVNICSSDQLEHHARPRNEMCVTVTARITGAQRFCHSYCFCCTTAINSNGFKSDIWIAPKMVVRNFFSTAQNIRWIMNACTICGDRLN
jgi:hypothetical protein